MSTRHATVQSNAFFGWDLMSETASDVRRTQPTPPNGEGADARAEGSTAARRLARPVLDEPTIITGRPPIPSPTVSDSTYRILEGRVMPGDRLGHFELVEYVGGGGMGRVFRAIDTQLGRTVALKVLPPDQSSDPDALQRFQNEAQSAARLDHDNIARAFYVGEDRGLHFIVFEFIEGVNVRLLVERKGPLPLAEAISYTLQVAEALAHADARSVVHRDIKPSNVLITPEGRVKLIDMGLARLRHADPAVADLTASGVTLGTFDYISPEQARDPRNADIRSDIYSLGCTFFFMLAGQPPFPEGTVLQKLLQHQGDQPPEIQQFRPELPEESSRILRKMMAKDPRHRYASPADLVADLLLMAEQIGLRPMSPTSRIWLVPQEPSVSFFQRHLPWLAPIAALVCIVLFLDLFWSGRDDQLPPSTDIEEPASVPAPARPKERSSRQSETQSREDLVSDTHPAAETGRSGEKLSTTTPRAQKTTTPVNGKASLAPTTPTRESENLLERGTSGRFNKAGLTFGSNGAGLSAAGEASGSPNVSASTSGSLSPVMSLPRPPTSLGTPTSTVETPAKRTGLLIVNEIPAGDDQFSTLSSACAAARNGDVIELRFNGLREDRPLKVTNLRVTIRGGEGYEPIIVFRPTDADPIKFPRSMITLATGQLTLSNVAVELDVPRGVPADNWSLFETWGGEMIRLERCVLTIRNASDQQSAYHQDVAFFRARSAPDADATVNDMPSATPLATLDLTDCIARGEADFLRVEGLQPVHLTWDNGLLLTTEHLLTAGGSQAAPKLDEMLRIELRHVTAAMRGGFCHLTSTSSNPHQLPVHFVSTNGITIGVPGVPLVEQEGQGNMESFRQRFLWNGDRNFYQETDIFWTIRGPDIETPPEVMGFEAWKTYWGPSRETQASVDKLIWKKHPEANRPLHSQGPGDYTLEDPTFDDASAGAPGCWNSRLPPLPPETAAQRSIRPSSVRGAGGAWRMDKG